MMAPILTERPGGVNISRRPVTKGNTMRNDGAVSADSPRLTADSFDPYALREAKGDRRISVCIPARDEAATVGPIVSAIIQELTSSGEGVALVDEVLVIDDGSTDGTGQLARAAGARVISSADPGGGKGQAMQSGLEAAEGDLIVFCDADVTNFGTHFVSAMVGPLLLDESRALVKGYYQRPLHGAADGGGRVTELMAKPLIDVLFPSLSSIEQPLAGETSAPRAVLEKCGLADGYAVELALLVDVASLYGVASIAQVDLGVRVHRNRPLSQLRPQATAILRAALERSEGYARRAD